MHKIRAILNAYDESQKNGETTFLVTIVNTKGSTYRRPGAKMLMTKKGSLVGAISGGCLENDIFQHTRFSMQSDEAIVITYDTTAEEDIIWGFGLGCNGVVQVLIERLNNLDSTPMNQAGETPTPQEKNLSTPQEKNLSTPQEKNLSTPEEKNLSTPQEKNLSTPQEKNLSCKIGILPVSYICPMTFLRECLHSPKTGVMATIFNVQGKVNAQIGNRLTLHPNGMANTDIKDINLTDAIIKDTQAAVNSQQSTVNQYQLSTGWVEVFIEVIQPPTDLVIFGAGRDAVPLAQFAKTLGWQVTVVDCRASEATRDRFPTADNIILTRRELLSGGVGEGGSGGKSVCVNQNTVVVVMTHNFLDDIEILKFLFPCDLGYLGVLGSQERTGKLLQELKIEGINYREKSQFYAPVGLDIGADTPEEIAIAIIAEIQAVLANRSGGMLRDRTQPIHSRTEIKTTHIEKQCIKS